MKYLISGTWMIEENGVTLLSFRRFVTLDEPMSQSKICQLEREVKHELENIHHPETVRCVVITHFQELSG